MPEVRSLTPELQTIAKRELNEDTDRLNADLAHIKEWLRKQPHLKARTDDQWLVSFLRGCKYSLERAKEKLDMYYTLKTMAPQLQQWQNPLDPKMKKLLKIGYITLLPSAGPDFPRVLFLRQGIINPSEFDFEEMLSVNFLIMKYLFVNDDIAVISGVQYVTTLEGTTFNNFVRWTPPLVKKAVTVFQNAFPSRIKSLHWVKMPSFFETVFNLAMTFLSEKLRSRIYIHSDAEKLHQYFPKFILPKDIGGNGPTFDELNDELIRKLEDFHYWYEEDAGYGCDENRRPGKPKNVNDIFGLEGSFRPLTID